MLNVRFLLRESTNFLYSIVVFFIVVAIFGCKQPPPQQTTSYSFDEIAAVFKTAENYFDSGRNHEVEAFLYASLPANKYIPDTFLLKKYEYLSIHYIQDVNNLDKARLYLDSLEERLNVLPKWDYYRLYLYFTRGDLAMKEKNIQEAYNHYFKGKIYIESDGDVCNQRKYYNSLAYVQYGLTNYNAALSYFLQEYHISINCLEKGRSLGVFPLVTILNNISHCYELVHKYDSAVFYQMEGLAYLSDSAIENSGIQNRGLRIKGVLLGNLGGSLLKLRKYNQARKYLVESIDINDSPSREPGDAILTKIKLADLYLQLFEYDSCKNLMTEVENNLKELPSLVASGRLANLRYRYHKNLGNFEEALLYREMDYALKDSILQTTLLNDFQPDFNKEFEYLAQRVKVLTLEKERNAQQFILVVLVISILFAAITIIMLIWRKKRNQQHIKELNDLNKQIKTINDQLQFSLSFLESAVEENERVSRVVAHDLRSPIAGILGLVNLLRIDETSHEEKDQYIQLIEQSGKNVLVLIDDLLQVQKNTPILLEPVDISGIIDACIQLLTQQAKQKQIQIEARLQSVTLPLQQEKIWRLFNNLITNAIKFSLPGGNIEIEVKDQFESVLVTVKDYGVGINEEMQPFLFNELPNGGTLGSNGEKSVGLGLAITKQIVLAHKGKIWFETAKNEGTTFFVELPKN